MARAVVVGFRVYASNGPTIKLTSAHLVTLLTALSTLTDFLMSLCYPSAVCVWGREQDFGVV